MSDQHPNLNPITNLLTDKVELQSTLSPITNVTQLFDSNFLFHETAPSTYVELPEVSSFSMLVQPFPSTHNRLEQFTPNVVSQPQHRMEVGESSHRRTPGRRLEFNQQVAQGEEGNFTRSQGARLHHIQRSQNHSQSERKRRERIRNRIRAMKELVPECKNTTADILDAAINYIRGMQSYLHIMSMGTLLRNIQMGSDYGMRWSPPPLAQHMIQNKQSLGYVPQPSKFVHRSFPPSVYTSVTPSIVVPRNFSSNVNQDWLNQSNPDDTGDDLEHL